MKQIFRLLIVFFSCVTGLSAVEAAVRAYKHPQSKPLIFEEQSVPSRQLALVVSDKAAKTFFHLFSNAAKNAEDAARGNQAEEKEQNNGGVKVERVEDLDVRAPSRSPRKDLRLDER